MVRTKQTPRGSASHQPGGMMTAKFTGMGRGKADPEEQFIDAPEEDTKEDLPLVLEDAVQKPKEGKQGASKSKGKKKAQAIERAEAPPEETPLDPDPPNHTPTQPLQNPSLAQARLPPKTLPRLPPKTPTRPPVTKLPSPLPETPTKMNPQPRLSMLGHTKQQARSG